MKAGFWIAPEGEDAVITIQPIDPEAPITARRSAFLATQEAEELIRRCPRTAELMPRLVKALAAQRAAQRGKLFDITDWSDEERKLIGEALGEGEVGGVAALPNGVTAQIQESVLPGLWRVRFTDAVGKEIADYLEVGAIPEAVREAGRSGGSDIVIGAPPSEAMNVMPVLAEVRERMTAYTPGDPAHAINFTLFPMSPVDMDFLRATLGVGSVRLVSRGYGYCRVTSTAARNVWSVQFTNSMDAPVLDTLEIVDAPAVVLAADEDFADSSARLAEIEDAYFK